MQVEERGVEMEKVGSATGNYYTLFRANGTDSSVR
jgi:hypothetical protein